MTKAEAMLINEAGIDIVSVFETTDNRASGGRVAGLIDGALAVQVAQKVGQPKSSCIYAAVDVEVKPSQMASIIAYIQAFSEATPDYTTGVYGSYAVIEAVSAAGACSRFWQTKAWSYGNRSPAAHIYQYDCGPKGLGLIQNGIGVDLNEGYGNEGAWNTLKEEEYVMNPEDANKVIGFLSAAHESTTDPEAREEFHRLANELRKVSGQPIY